jgi:hypothetical protein
MPQLQEFKNALYECLLLYASQERTYSMRNDIIAHVEKHANDFGVTYDSVFVDFHEDEVITVHLIRGKQDNRDWISARVYPARIEIW